MPSRRTHRHKPQVSLQTPEERAPRTNPPPQRAFGWYAGAVFAVALIIRFVHIWQLQSAPFFNVLMGDAQSYHSWGSEIAAGDWFGNETFYQAPLYPYFLGSLYTLFGQDLLTVRLGHALLGSASCALLALAGHRLFSRNVGVLAGLMLAVYAPALFFDGLIQKATLGMFLLCAALALLSQLASQPRQRWTWLWVGVILGGLIITRENAMVFAIAVLAWLALSRTLGRPRFLFAGIFVLGLGVVLLPVALRNQLVGDEFLLTTAQFGPNLYIGNNPEADGTYQPLVFGRGDPRYERQDATQLAERAVGRTLTPGQVSQYWTSRALDYIRTQPGDWLRLTYRKVILAANRSEVADTEDQLSHADWSIPLRVTGYVWHFGTLAPLAVAGMWLTWRQRHKLSLFYVMLAAYAGSLVIFAIMGRYRYPLVPILVLFAAAGIVASRHVIECGWNQSTRRGIAAIAAMLVLCNWPVLSMSDMRAVTALNLGTEFQAQGRLDDAIAQYQQVLLVTPDDALTHSNLGTALAAQGKPEEAVDHYEQALALAPGDADSYSNLGNALAALNRTEDAISNFRRALDIDPSSAAAHGALGIALQSQGQIAEAVVHLRRAVTLAPAPADLHNHLGVAFASQDQLDEATTQFDRALDLDPDFLDAHANLAMVAQLQGSPDQAIHHYREILRINPSSSDAHNDLGLTLAARDELRQAIEHFRQAIAVEPDFAQAHGNLATALHLQGNLEDAILHYRAAQQIAPDIAEFQIRLNAALAELAAR